VADNQSASRSSNEAREMCRLTLPSADSEEEQIVEAVVEVDVEVHSGRRSRLVEVLLIQ
jgi:hypothetical protein